MKSKIPFILTICLLALLIPALPSVAKEQGKFLILLQTGKETHEGSSRALHALLYAKELKEHGHEVVLIFDGAGTEWAYDWVNPDSTSELQPLFKELREKLGTWIICDYCAAAFKVKRGLTVLNVPLTSEYEGHPSIAKWADEGYQIIVL